LEFQSTLPAGGATLRVLQSPTRSYISIHAPRGGSDLLRSYISARRTHFNPRSPRGERRSSSRNKNLLFGFQSTLPAGGATRQSRLPITIPTISIHAPRGGSDISPFLFDLFELEFQSTLPAGGATAERFTLSSVGTNFNPRSPRGERPLF